MKIEPITSKNLLHVFKKRLINAQQIDKILKSCPNSQRLIGTLPFDFFKNIPKTERANITQTVGDIFERFSIETDQIEDSRVAYALGISNATENLTSVLKKVLKRDDISCKYIASGSFKNCHKLSIGNFSYALSTFKKYPLFDIRGYYIESHGKGNEPQNIFTIYNRFSHGRICRPFLANLSTEKDKGGFILSKYIEPQHPAKKELGKFVKNRNYLKNKDVRGNSINGIYIEAGGFVLNKGYIKEKQLRTEWKQYAENIDSYIEILNNKNGAYIEDLILNSDINTFDFINKLNPKNKKTALKMLKHLKRLDDLKQKSIKNGTYTELQKLLKEDFCKLYPFNLYSKEFNPEATELQIYKDYPRLVANLLDVDNVPNLKNMLKILEDDFCFAEIDFTQYYTRDEAIETYKNHYNEIRKWDSFNLLINAFEL